jgi:hypothetical protein
MARPSLRCMRCQGTGRVRAHMHIESGRCFQCHGAGVVQTGPTPRPHVRRALDHAHEARVLYRVARSQQDRGWGEDPYDDGSDVARDVAYHLSFLPADRQALALDAFREVVSPVAFDRIERHLSQAVADEDVKRRLGR